MLKGINVIRAYCKEHEDPKNGVNDVSVKASQILDLGIYVMESIYYRVHWQAKLWQGVVTGKNMMVWQRGPTVRLLIYQQRYAMINVMKKLFTILLCVTCYIENTQTKLAEITRAVNSGPAEPERSC